jgi:hypothetical protein
MNKDIIEIQSLTFENVWNLSEEEVFHLLEQLREIPEKEIRNDYMKIIDSAFEFRSITRSRRDLKEGLSMHGFKFFDNRGTKIQTGICKRKTPRRTVFA